MKICAVICEYNPFHEGHRRQLEVIKKTSGCDAILCLMSGNFTQRGDAALFSKFVRARHAILNGADVVLELPAAFAASPAELFAGGAVHILSSIPSISHLCFGCESGTREDFLSAARATLSEDKTFKTLLKENMKDGTSYIRARQKTALSLNPSLDEALFTSPNNILGVEYTRAILERKSKIEILPLKRSGAGHADKTLQKELSSSSAIRKALESPSKKAQKLLKKNLPSEVYKDLSSYRPIPYKEAALCALLAKSPDEVLKAPDCSEGLENRLRAMAKSNPSYEAALSKVVSKRYTLSRLKRILLQNFLSISRREVRSFLEAPLYYKVLAVPLGKQGELLKELSKGEFPLLSRKSDLNALKREALSCFEIDQRANDLYCALSGTFFNHNETLFL